MYIIAIGYLYVVFMVCIMAENILAGLFWFLLVGVAPMALWSYLHYRRFRAKARAHLKTQDEMPEN